MLNDNQLKPTKEEIKKALERSGYLLEQRICPIIEKFDFLVTPNEQYEDQDSGKSREIDVHAIMLNSLYRSEFIDTFQTVLIIECKNNATPVIFFTQKNPIPESVFGYVIVNGYPDGIYDETLGEVESIEDYFHFEKFHHNYRVQWIARQFCQLKPKVINKGSKKEEIEWEVSPNEDLYDSTESLVKATEYYSTELKTNFVLDNDTKDNINLGIIYLILLFSGPIFECQIMDKQYKLVKKKHLVLYKTIQSKTLEGTYHIDVLQESYLRKFLNDIVLENNKIVSFLKKKQKLLKANVERNYREQKKPILQLATEKNNKSKV